jgi:acyl transferase domain-containing protein
VSAPAAAFKDSTTAVDAISAIPLQRWDWEALSSSATGTGTQLPARFGGWLSGVDMFDAAAFGVSGVEAMLMDAQQRMLLELSLTALTGASVAAAAAAAAAGEAALQSSTSSSSIVSGDQHGCIAVGIASAEYNNFLLQRTGAATSAYSATGEF